MLTIWREAAASPDTAVAGLAAGARRIVGKPASHALRADAVIVRTLGVAMISRYRMCPARISSSTGSCNGSNCIHRSVSDVQPHGLKPHPRMRDPVLGPHQLKLITATGLGFQEYLMHR